MRKTLTTIALVVALLMSCVIPAFAADQNGVGAGNYACDVNGTYVAGTPASEIVSVDIAWGEMSFTYTDGDKGQWNPDTHTFGADAAGTWAASGNTITVTNHSNTAVKAALSFEADVAGVTGSFNKAELNLATAVGTTVANAPKDTAILTLAGKITATGKVGTIKVVITNE